MAYPYKKMDEDDFAYIRSVTACDRVWVGDEIAREYYRDEMPEHVFPRSFMWRSLIKEEISAIMAYAYENNIPVVCRGGGTGLAGGATCKYGGIMLSVMRMNRIFPVDHKNQTITAEPGALLLDIQQAASSRGRTVLSAGSRRKNSLHRRKCHHQRRRHEGGPLRTDQGFCPVASRRCCRMVPS
ncbi:MAG: FAD-binding oxidoreductase [Lachnospiraceae bacterium]